MALSKVEKVEFKNEWTSNYGIMYSYMYKMEDGTVLEANHKSNKGFDVGFEVEYEITKDDEFGKKGKVGKPQEEKYQNHNNNSNNKSSKHDVQLLIIRQSSLTRALEYHSNDGFKTDEVMDQLKEITDTADIFTNWVMTGKNDQK